MKPAFDSLSAFLAMGGYAFYVWLSVIVTLLALGGLMLHTALQRQHILREVRQRQARERRRHPRSQPDIAGEQP